MLICLHDRSSERIDTEKYSRQMLRLLICGGSDGRGEGVERCLPRTPADWFGSAWWVGAGGGDLDAEHLAFWALGEARGCEAKVAQLQKYVDKLTQDCGGVALKLVHLGGGEMSFETTCDQITDFPDAD